MPKYRLRPKEQEVIRVVTDTIEDEQVLMGAVAHAMHKRVEARRVAKHEEHYRLAASVAFTGLVSSPMSPDKWIAGICFGAGSISGLAAAYIHAHPPQPHDMPELPPNLNPPILVMS